jgi:hypothetical protein
MELLQKALFARTNFANVHRFAFSYFHLAYYAIFVLSGLANKDQS